MNIEEFWETIKTQVLLPSHLHLTITEAVKRVGATGFMVGPALRADNPVVRAAMLITDMGSRELSGKTREIIEKAWSYYEEHVSSESGPQSLESEIPTE